MGVVATGLGWSSYGDWKSRGKTSYLSGLQSKASNDTGSHNPPYLHIHTDERPEQIARFRVSACWRVVPKGVTGYYGYWSDLIWSRIDKSDMFSFPAATGHDWSVELTGIGYYKGGGTVLTPSGTTVGKEVAPNGWGYSKRVNDTIQLQIVVVAEYADGYTDQYGATETGRYTNEGLFIGYVPEYSLTGVALVEDGLDVTYGAPGWSRQDDRWRLWFLRQGDRQFARSESVYGETFGYVEAPGRIHVPMSALTGVPEAGEVWVRFSMNPSYRADGDFFATLEGTAEMSSVYECNTPTASVRHATQDELGVLVGDSGDLGSPISTVYVALDGYVGEVVTAAPGSVATIPLPPLGVDLTVVVWGVNATGATSDQVRVTVPAIEGAEDGTITIAPVSGGATVTLRYNPEEKWSYEPEMTSVKFSGRERESVGYGTGGSVTGTVSCLLPADPIFGPMEQDEADFRALAFAGVCVLRSPRGTRRRVAVESVDESWAVADKVKQVSISVKEVS